MKKFNYKNKREYLNKTRNAEKKSNESSTSSSLAAKKNLGNNWKNYEEDNDDDDGVASNLNEINAAAENFNFDELLESSSWFKKKKNP